jgi:hypothetical protein
MLPTDGGHKKEASVPHVPRIIVLLWYAVNMKQGVQYILLKLLTTFKVVLQVVYGLLPRGMWHKPSASPHLNHVAPTQQKSCAF